MTLTTLVMEMPLGEHEKSLIGAYGQASITNKFSLGAQAFDLLLPWINMLAFNKEANQKEALKFINDFLKLSIDPDILKRY